MKNAPHTLTRNLDIYRDALEAASRGQTEFEFCAWDYKTDDVLDDFIKDVKAGKIKVGEISENI